jgi:hypothetical protein
MVLAIVIILFVVVGGPSYLVSKIVFEILKKREVKWKLFYAILAFIFSVI